MMCLFFIKDDASSIMSSDEELPPAFLSRVVPGKVVYRELKLFC